MKNTDLLKQLKNIAKLMQDIGTREDAKNSINNLILDVERETLKEDYKGKTSKQRIDYAMKWHKRQLKTIRPILAYSCKDQIENYQVITDAYFLVFLNNDDELPISHYTEYMNGKVNYPNTLQLYKNVEKGEEIKLDIKKVVALLNVKEDNEIRTEYNGYKLIIDKKKFNELLVFMDVKDNSNVKILIDNQVLKMIKNNGSKGMMVLGRTPLKENNTDFNELLIQE